MNRNGTSWMRWWPIDAAGLLVCVLIGVLGFYSLVRPTFINQLTYERLQPQVTERTQQLTAIRSEVLSIEKQLSGMQAQLEALPLRLEQSSRVNTRLARLADLATDTGLVVYQMLPDKTRAGERYNIVPIALSGSGDYNHVTGYMRRIHDTFADMAIVRFDMTSDNPDKADASFDIYLAWYTLPSMGMVENP